MDLKNNPNRRKNVKQGIEFWFLPTVPNDLGRAKKTNLKK